MVRALFLLVVLCAPAASRAQTPVDRGLGVDRLGIADGLPGMYVSDLATTADGRLWLVASGRLVSFDGLEFEEHPLARFPNGDPVLRDVTRGRGDTLWVVVGTELFSYVGGRSARRAGHDAILRSVWQDEDGEIRGWDDAGALRLSGSTFERVVRLAPGWNLGNPAALRTGGRGDLWLHHLESGGLRRVNTERILAPLPFPESWPLPDPGRRTLLAWTGVAGTEITRLDGTPVATVPAGSGGWPLLVDRQGLVWTQAGNRALAVDGSGTVVASLPLAPDARVTSAIEDAEGNVWLGTLTHGLFRIRPLPVRAVGADEGLTDRQVRRLSGGAGPDVLALDDEGRVSRIGPEGVETLFEPSEADGRAYAATVDRRGTLWLSVVAPDGHELVGRTADGGVHRLRLGVGPRIVEDPLEQGVLWLSGGGVVRLRPYAPGGLVAEGPMLEAGWGVRDLLVGPDGVVWVVGTRGLARISDRGVDRWLSDDGFPTGGRAVHRTSDGTLWIGHYADGLVRFREGEFRRVTREDGLWDDGASTILEDDHGNLWMSSNRGVHRAALRDLNAFLDGEIDRVRGRGYGPGAGFQNPETSGWSGYRDPDGRLWFPTFSGAAVIDPEEVLAREQAPPGIRIRRVTAGPEPLAPDSAVTLPKGERRVDVAFGAILLSGHGGVRYQAHMEGVDADWVDAGGQRQVTYGALGPGRHVFRARAVSGAGVASVEEARVALVVPPFFYETGAFRLLLAMAAGGALWLLYHLRVRHLRQRAVTLRGMVDERTRDLARAQRETQAALETVEAQAAALRSLDEAKSRFFANVSHELRTPLTLVQGPLQDVLDGRLGATPDAVRRQVATVLASGRRLGQLVEQLLDVARLESNELRLDLRREDLAPLFRRLRDSFEALARSRGITFEARVPDGPIQARVDADQMEKVWANLLSNAFKFTPERGRVGLEAEVREDGGVVELVVTVEDEGPGIPAEELGRIFERFHQVDDSSRRAHGGAGLGLALVKEITELHGGSVEVWSEEGRGSRFTVRVPVGEADADAETLVPVAAASSEAPPVGRPHSTPAPDPDPDDTERPTVLVVEDNDELRAYLRRHLEVRYRVVEAGNGREGLEAARAGVPDLVLCDVMMPEMDGEELCRALRDDPELAFLPVVMLTARASRESRLSALEGGADDYLVKPFDPEELRLRVRNLFAARRRLAERLRDQGRTLPFVPLDRPPNGGDRDFAVALEAVLRRGMADEDFGVDDIAKGMSMSRATLYRKAGEDLDTSPMELLWGYRLDQAAHWLRETDATVSEAAYGAGFKTVPHFTRRFKERFGVTPAAYGRGEG